MKIGRKLNLSFLGIALLIGTVGYFSIFLSSQVCGLRNIELPMEQNLREVEVSIWEMIHAADSYRLTGHKFYEELYHNQIGDVEKFYPNYQALTDTDEEKKYIEEFNTLWEEAKKAGSKMIELTIKQKAAEKAFFINVDEADDVLDYAIQSKWSQEDSTLLAKEQAVREVEVSIWEAIHAAQQYLGLSGNILRGSQKYIGLEVEAANAAAKASLVKGDFNALMEKQFEDVDEFWTKYKNLPLEDFENIAIQEFEGFWDKAVIAGREVVSLQDQAEEQFNTLYEKVDKADDVLDSKMQVFIQNRIERENTNAMHARTITIAILIFAFVCSLTIGLFIAYSITGSVTRLSNATDEISKGKLDTLIEITSKDEIGDLADKFNKMTTGLREVTASRDELDKEIANRKITEQSLIESEKKNRTWLENSPACTKIVDLDFNLQYMSAAGIKALKIDDVTKLYGKPYPFGFYPEPFRNLMINNLEKAKETGEIIKQEASVVDIDGNELWFHSTLVPVTDDEDRIDYIIIVSIDITERKKSEQALIESEKSNRAWLDNSPVCTKVVDLDFNLQYMSAAGIKALKIDDVTKLYGTPYPFDFFPESFKNSMTKDLEKVKRTGEIITKEAPIADIEGNKLWFQATLVPVRDSEGRIDFIIIVSVDINERKKMEEALIQSEKLKAMGTITSGIAHDFNNILAVISGTTQVLEMNNEDNKKLMEGLHTIHMASNDGGEIVRRMRMFTKQENDTSALLPIDIKNELKQAIEFSKPRWMNIARASGIDYDIDVDGIMEVPIIMGNESELREVFINIINNAMDAMERGGRLSFRTWQNEGNIFISISDTGDGMSDEVMKMVFEPFYTTKRAKGSGLGMSMSYGIMKRHSGSIEIKSEEGEGTTFTLRLPIAVLPVQKTEPPVEHQEIKVKDLSVLVVDDNEDIHSPLEMFFVNSGHKAKAVDSGKRAIEVLNTEAFDLVLCDIVMPDISGYEVVAVLNSLEKRPKIGMMTGWSEKIKDEEENKLNVDFTIKKPFEFSVLAGHINDAFGADSR